MNCNLKNLGLTFQVVSASSKKAIVIAVVSFLFVN